MERSIAFSVCAVAALIFLSGAKAGDVKNAVFSDCASICPAMVRIDGGTFLMGLPDGEPLREDPNFEQGGRFEIERPQHSETVKSFAIGRYDVTRGEFATFIADSGYKMENGCAEDSIDSLMERKRKSWRDPGFPQTDRHPVVCVSWDDANAYAAWLSRKTGQGYRLPTEAEWEYAARARTTSARYWGRDNACKYANVFDLSALRIYAKPNKPAPKPFATGFRCDDGYVRTSPVGVFKPNGFGLYDMLGNVEQWVADCLGPYDADKKSALMDKVCDHRVTRGGSWGGDPFGVRSASRGNHMTIESRNIAIRFTDTGFRVARDLRPAEK
ncbi:MAG TPA: formylglycine-generating enzyme family protein [Rhizomicrobium sp.]|nr:formylglycine-generating enzyme family protein [Rhizomicrobium sp.]